MAAYYNEHEPFAAQWIRNLIAAGLVAPGDVDERSIEDVHPDDLRPYTQCHFFAGIAIWSYSLRLAGWPDDRPVWTGSCPCQPFSAAGAGAGFDDPRHLWPHFAWLIRERRPSVVFGEQVASKDAGPWVDLVQADLEALEYAFGAVPFPSAGVGAPHIRDRLFWMAHRHVDRRPPAPRTRFHHQEYYAESRGLTGGMGHSDSERVRRYRRAFPGAEGPAAGEMRGQPDAPQSPGAIGIVANAQCRHPPKPSGSRPGPGNAEGTRAPGGFEGCGSRPDSRSAGPVNGFWRDADWLLCRDGRWRPTEPGTFPLAHGAPSRVGRLRAYGNAINAEAAAAFIEAAMGCMPA
ncbi:DNA cytosine methyltransferase [Pseudomonas sp. RIT-PI-AD]|uniref:DNA cytosine methyltransferase n=1 Tax=Pseudomonas sp. RIT-PI-AD TaxID=3035294 RepID=UPI0021DB1C20|nr:DNA cytosine methyltransferase [Pseudomonas sp. RIT-PI-AD]